MAGILRPSSRPSFGQLRIYRPSFEKQNSIEAVVANDVMRRERQRSRTEHRTGSSETNRTMRLRSLTIRQLAAAVVNTPP